MFLTSPARRRLLSLACLAALLPALPLMLARPARAASLVPTTRSLAVPTGAHLYHFSGLGGVFSGGAAEGIAPLTSDSTGAISGTITLANGTPITATGTVTGDPAAPISLTLQMGSAQVAAAGSVQVGGILAGLITSGGSTMGSFRLLPATPRRFSSFTASVVSGMDAGENIGGTLVIVTDAGGGAVVGTLTPSDGSAPLAVIGRAQGHALQLALALPSGRELLLQGGMVVKGTGIYRTLIYAGKVVGPRDGDAGYWGARY